MSSALRSGYESDKIVVEVVVEPSSGRILRSDDPAFPRARGTRQQLPLSRELARSAEPPAEPSPPAGTSPPSEVPPVRDPISVLRTWPVSTLDRDDASALPRQTLRAPSPGPHFDDKIRLAHLALDLYRELEASAGRASSARPAGGEPASACADRRCQARDHVLRGALVEACLLVQRVALMSPELGRQDEVIARVRDLLAMIES
ncbi:MAG TPA: hypothetical protein VFP84_30040 [Kofleriaceae bacterium]|nr:hypothetical protein [Kofleriaceae bacterium]